MKFTYEETPWQLYSRRLKRGASLSALHLLTLLEGEDEDGVEDAFATIQELGIRLDITDLPKGQPSGELGTRLAWEHRLCQEGSLLTDLEENDPLRLYLEELAGIPACGDVQLLSMELLDPIPDSRRQALCQMLLNLCLSRVVEQAKTQAGNRVLLIDLIQEGSMGAWQTILAYQGGDLQAQADVGISNAIARAITLQAREDGVGQKMRGLCDDYRAADRSLLTQLGRNPTLEEVAARLNITPEEAWQVETLVKSAALLAKAKQAVSSQEETQEDQQSVEDTALFQSRVRIQELLEGLSEPHAQVLSLRFGLEGGLPLNVQEVAARLNLTAQEVVSMEAAALEQIRKKV